MPINVKELCNETAKWLSQWTFTAFITLTNYREVRPHRDIPSSYDRTINRYLSRAQKLLGVPIAAFGINTLSHNGYLHSHLVTFKQDMSQLSILELKLFEKEWHFDANAQQVTDQNHLLGYIASEAHLKDCREHSFYMFGDNLLLEKKKTPPPKKTSRA